VFHGNCAVGCGSGTACVTWYLCFIACSWNEFCWMVTVLQTVVVERIFLDGNYAVKYGSGTDCVGW
jgi:hypothetical protein